MIARGGLRLAFPFPSHLASDRLPSRRGVPYRAPPNVATLVPAMMNATSLHSDRMKSVSGGVPDAAFVDGAGAEPATIFQPVRGGLLPKFVIDDAARCGAENGSVRWQ
jgi:hypothetical protein